MSVYDMMVIHIFMAKQWNGKLFTPVCSPQSLIQNEVSLTVWSMVIDVHGCKAFPNLGSSSFKTMLDNIVFNLARFMSSVDKPGTEAGIILWS